MSKKRSLLVVNAHLIRFAHPFRAACGVRPEAREPVFNAVMATQTVFQHPVKVAAALFVLMHGAGAIAITTPVILHAASRMRTIAESEWIL
jgi:hypothetical protein